MIVKILQNYSLEDESSMANLTGREFAELYFVFSQYYFYFSNGYLFCKKISPPSSGVFNKFKDVL